jgi:hypothetical protein
MHLLSRLLLSAFLVLGGAAQARAQSAPPIEPETRLYIVLFGFTVDATSKVQDFRIVKVFEPLTGTNAALPIKLPPAFVDAARAQVEASRPSPNLKDGKPIESLTTFLHTRRTRPADAAPATPFSLVALEGVWARVNSFTLLDQSCQSSIYGAAIGRGFVAFTYYAVPIARNSEAEREALLEAELKRGLANFGGGQVISRKAVPLPHQSIVEVVVKSPRSKVLSLRLRLICTATTMLAVTATVPDDLDPDSVQALDKIFATFHIQPPPFSLEPPPSEPAP